MAHKLVFRPRAAEDLRTTYVHIAEEAGHDRAGDYLERIEKACRTLQTFPERGTVRDQILPGLRVIGFERSASIAFRVIGDTVEVLRVLRRGQDIPSNFVDD